MVKEEDIETSAHWLLKMMKSGNQVQSNGMYDQKMGKLIVYEALVEVIYPSPFNAAELDFVMEEVNNGTKSESVSLASIILN